MVRSLVILALAGAAFAAPVAQSIPIVGSLLGGTSTGSPIAGLPGLPAVLGGSGVTTSTTGSGINGIPLPRSVSSSVILTRDVEKLSQRELADIEAPLYAVVKLLVALCAKVGIDVQVLLGNVKVTNSSILTDILNGNNIHVARGLAFAEAIVAAAIKALVIALVKLDVPVQAALANINISYSDILDGILQYNNISVLSKRSLVDVLAIVKAIVKALVQACADVDVDITAAIANLDIEYSTILSNIANGNNITILRRDALATVVVDLLAYVTVLIDAVAKANINVVAELLNIGIDCSTILSNIANGNNISVLHRDLLNVLVPVKLLVQALIQVLAKVDANAALSILNVVIQNSSIGSNILNDNVIHVL